MKSKYEQLNNQHVTLEKKLTEENLIQLDNAPIVVRGEKEWQEWAQDLVDFEDKQTEISNTRIPYASTLLQLDSENAPIVVRGEKEW